MSSYTGPVVVIPFVGKTGKTEFALTLHVLVDDPEAIKTIIKRYADDGYTAALNKKRSYFMRNGTLEEPETRLGPAGYIRRLAGIRA